MFKWFTLSLFLLLSACGLFSSNGGVDYKNVDTTNISELEQIRVKPIRYEESNAQLSNLRVKSLQDSAMTIGAQGGLAWESKAMNTRLQNDGKYLDSIFNFYALVLPHGVIPPVLEAGDNSLNLADPNTIRVADRTYRIVKQARFATTPPNWREYIWLNYFKPELPDRTLLPRTPEEQRIWRDAIRVGWEKGIDQAHNIFKQNLATLQRDYRGMLLYRKLLTQRMISPPFVARTELGVTGDGNDMRINDQVLRIVELPKLQTNTKRWQAVVVKRND